jgi:hypothetical protein
MDEKNNVYRIYLAAWRGGGIEIKRREKLI